MVDVEAAAPAAGTWWFRITPDDRWAPDRRYRLETRIFSGHATTSSDLTATPRQRVRVNFDPQVATRITIANAEPLPESLLLAVHTVAAARFHVWTSLTWRPHEQGTAAPELPSCDPNKPDFTNERCCHTNPGSCVLVAGTCRRTVIAIDQQLATIALGARDGIMRHAGGVLSQDGVYVSDVIVIDVRDADSTVRILDPKLLNSTTILANGRIQLRQPERCERR